MSSTKVPISLRIDPKILNWFRQSQPSGYQSAMHQVLADHVAKELAKTFHRTGRAQELFRKFYAQCFWHLDPNLEITPDNLKIVIDGLKRHGGREGFILADELCH